MNPEGVPPYGSKYQSYPEQSGGPKVIKRTPVNIVTDPPKDHIIWSLFMFVYCNPFCLGLTSLIHSIKSRDRKMVGDVEGARHYGLTARNFNIAASVVAVVVIVIPLILYFSIIMAVIQRYKY